MVKTPDEIALMRISGKLLASVFEMLDTLDLTSMSTMDVNDLVDRFITVDLAARPASKGQYGFKYVLNCSINHVVCHGVPDTRDIIRDGDIINLDITLEKDGFIADSSKTYMVGEVAPGAKRLVRVAQEAMWQGIKQVRPGAYLGDIGFAIDRHARKNGYSIVRDYCGHGIGREMHEEPSVLNFGWRGTGLKLRGHGLHHRADGEPGHPQGHDPERRVDRRDERPQALGPVRTYGRGHRDRRRSPDAAPRREADAGRQGLNPDPGPDRRGSHRPRDLVTKCNSGRPRTPPLASIR